MGGGDGGRRAPSPSPTPSGPAARPRAAPLASGPGGPACPGLIALPPGWRGDSTVARTQPAPPAPPPCCGAPGACWPLTVARSRGASSGRGFATRTEGVTSSGTPAPTTALTLGSARRRVPETLAVTPGAARLTGAD